MISEGDTIPDLKLMRAGADGPEPVGTHELMGRGRTVLFAVPGAFTPTCSARHLPGYVDHAGDFRAKGVDRIVCTSVNDAFVMGAWAEGSGVGTGEGDIVMLADGNAEFARAMGLVMDGKGYGMGQRSQRYAAVIEDGVVRRLAVEEGGGFGVSSAEEVLSHL